MNDAIEKHHNGIESSIKAMRAAGRAVHAPVAKQGNTTPAAQVAAFPLLCVKSAIKQSLGLQSVSYTFYMTKHGKYDVCHAGRRISTASCTISDQTAAGADYALCATASITPGANPRLGAEGKGGA